MPGGDPLAAALAAGETPSPEMVAASGLKEGLRPAVAIGLLVVFVTRCVSHLEPVFALLSNSPISRSGKQRGCAAGWEATIRTGDFQGKRPHVSDLP